MKQTTNYHLNQWDPGDRLLRTDFNGDNGKIDTAIQATETAVAALSARVTTLESKVGLKLLREMTTTVDAQAMSIPLNDLDWNHYRKIHVEIVPYSKSGFYSVINLYLQNNSSKIMGVCNGNTIGKSVNSTFWTTFFPMFSVWRGLGTLTFANKENKFMSFDASCIHLSALVPTCMNGDDMLLAGTLARIYGEV